jgi:hypothetical protein
VPFGGFAFFLLGILHAGNWCHLGDLLFFYWGFCMRELVCHLGDLPFFIGDFAFMGEWGRSRPTRTGCHVGDLPSG